MSRLLCKINFEQNIECFFYYFLTHGFPVKTIFWSIQSILSNPPYPIQPSYPIQSHSITSDQIIPSNRYSWPSEKGKLQIRRKCSALQNIYLPTSLTLRGDSRRSDISTSENSKVRAITIWFSSRTHEGLFSQPCFLFGSMQLMHSMHFLARQLIHLGINQIKLYQKRHRIYISKIIYSTFHNAPPLNFFLSQWGSMEQTRASSHQSLEDQEEWEEPNLSPFYLCKFSLEDDMELEVVREAQVGYCRCSLHLLELE